MITTNGGGRSNSSGSAAAAMAVGQQPSWGGYAICHGQITVSLSKLIELRVVHLSGCLSCTRTSCVSGFSGISGVSEIG